MSFAYLDNISDSAKIYLRPVHYIESPQQHEGLSARLGGSMQWFCSVELITITEDETRRAIIPVHAFDDAMQALPPVAAERAKRLYTNITASRAPLQLGSRTIRLDQPQVMGILNVTPDSFSDGGENTEAQSALASAHAMTSAGAAMIDVGGESTRPGAAVVWEGDEITRTQPVIEKLSAAGTAISIDTRKAAVMEAAIAAGAGMINDISALLYDDRSLEVAQKSGATIAIMHAPSQGEDPHKNAIYQNIVTDIYDFLEDRISALIAEGIDKDKIIVDPGIGFGKSLSDNLAIINNLAIYHGLGCPILFGASRKRMIGALSKEEEASERLGGSVYLALRAIEQGAHIVRVHDVAETVQAVNVWRGLRDGAFTVPAA